MRSKEILKDMTPYQPGKQIEEVKKEYGLNKIVKLASNENPFGCSPQVREYITQHMPDLHLYPDGYTYELRRSLADRMKISENQLIFGNGTDELVQIIGRAFLYPGVNTIVPTPTFPQYKQNALIEGAEVKEIPTIDGYLDLKGMLASINDNTNVVWLCSPNNPTGRLIEKHDLYSFLANCPEHVLVVLDEAYQEYVEEELKPEITAMLQNHSNLLVLRTFSKAYGLAGLRIGYGIANPELVSSLDVVRGPFNTSTLAQQAAQIALEDQEFLSDIIQRNHTVKLNFEHSLDSIGWDYFKSQTNFLLVSTPVSGEDVFQYLLRSGFIVRPGEKIGIPKTIRITMGKERDMEELQNVLYQFHQDLNGGS